MRRFLGWVLVLLVLTPTAAAAHANWVKTSPDHGATLDSLPAEATVSFSEAPTKADVVLRDPDGTVHGLSPRVNGATVTVQLPATGPRGDYTLSYRVVSADGHPVSGSTTFTVTTGPAPTVQTPAPRETTTPVPGQAEASAWSTLAMAGGAALVALAAGVLFWLIRR